MLQNKQRWSQDCNKSNDRYSVCLLKFQIDIGDDLIHHNGPRNNLCAGSNQLPSPFFSQTAVISSSLLDDFLRIAGEVALFLDITGSSFQNVNGLQEDVIPPGQHFEYLVLRETVITHIPKNAQHCAS